MRRVLKWIGIVLGALLGVVLIAIVVLFIKGTRELQQTMTVPTDHVDVSADQQSLARGKEIVTSFCAECHGEDLGGQEMINDPTIGAIYAANLTAGQGGIQATHSEDDLVRSIRHGVAPDGRLLMIMPSAAFNYFSREDISAVIAYLRTVPPVDHVVPAPAIAPIGRVMLGAGLFGNVFPAEVIDHTNPFPPMPEIGANAAYGEYFTRLCRECHGPDLAGGPSTEPGSPPAPNLTMSGELVGWSEQDFVTALTTGVTPSGHNLNPEYMPWEAFKGLSTDELRGIFMYLQTLN